MGQMTPKSGKEKKSKTTGKTKEKEENRRVKQDKKCVLLMEIKENEILNGKCTFEKRSISQMKRKGVKKLLWNVSFVWKSESSLGA